MFSKHGLTRLDDVLTAHAGPDGIPGLAWVVARGDEVHAGTAGTMDGTTPVQRDSIFRIASMSKPVTAVAVLTLVEDCVIRLDDPLAEYLPEIADRRVMVDPLGSIDDTVPALRQPTVHDALTFRLGWGMDFANFETQTVPAAMAEAMGLPVGPPHPATTPPPDEFAKILGRFPLDHQPGERWLYNMGSEVLSILITRVAGTSLGEYLQRRIFEPLGMTDTGFWVPTGKLDRFGPCYLPPAWAPHPGAAYDPTDGEWSAPASFESGAGGLVSTIDDYLAFARMLLGGGGDVLSRASVAAMTTDQLVAVDGSPQGGPDPTGALGWGFGCGVVRRKTHVAESVGTYAWTGGLGSSWANDPAEGLIGILLTNQMFSGPVLPVAHQDFWTCAYTALP